MKRLIVLLVLLLGLVAAGVFAQSGPGGPQYPDPPPCPECPGGGGPGAGCFNQYDYSYPPWIRYRRCCIYQYTNSAGWTTWVQECGGWQFA